MSTVDPVRRVKERQASRVGSSRAAIWLLLSAIVTLAAGLICGMAVAWMFDLNREHMINSIFADAPELSMSLVWTTAVGPILAVAAGGMMTAAAKAYTGHLFDFPVVGPVTIGLIGAVPGVMIGIRYWTPPMTVGVRTDPVFGDDEVWSQIDWIAYHATTWLPLLTALLALVSLVSGIHARRRKASRRRDLDRLLVEGHRVVGDITDISTPSEGSAILTPWTVHFLDRSLTDRWVTSHGRFERNDIPKVGDLVSVLYDPMAPGDKHRIYIGGMEAVTADDFLRWRL